MRIISLFAKQKAVCSRPRAVGEDDGRQAVAERIGAGEWTGHSGLPVGYLSLKTLIGMTCSMYQSFADVWGRSYATTLVDSGRHDNGAWKRWGSGFSTGRVLPVSALPYIELYSEPYSEPGFSVWQILGDGTHGTIASSLLVSWRGCSLMKLHPS